MAIDILFNKSGTPLMISSKRAFMSTTGSPVGVSVEEKKKLIKTVGAISDQDMTKIGSVDLLSWGANNDFPQWADNIITTTGVLNTGLKFLRNLTMGQGLHACLIDGYDKDGNEILKPHPDNDLQRYVNSRKVRRYMEKVLRDYFKFGTGFAQLVPNTDGSKIIGINPLNAYYSRLSKRDADGLEKCVVSGKWPETPTVGEFAVYDVLMEYDPELDLDIRKHQGKSKESVIMVVRDSWSNKDTYSEPVWLACFLAGWIDIAKDVPKYLKKVNKNQATWKWHIQIPYSFWDKRFPESEYDTIALRQKAIDEYMDDIETNLLGAENAEKPLFTHYAINDSNGKIEEEWKITPLDNKSKEGDKLVTSAAANSEILFSLMINPNVMGAGMPGGTYAGNQGGSNIREAFLVNIANAWLDRQNLLDPLEVQINYNGYKDAVLRYRNTILTTLNTGAGTQQNLA